MARYNGKPVGAIHTSPAKVAEIINAHVTQFIKFQKYNSVEPNAARCCHSRPSSTLIRSSLCQSELDEA
jgi:hypothetical protein